MSLFMFFENYLNIEIPQARISQKLPQIGSGGLIRRDRF